MAVSRRAPDATGLPLRERSKRARRARILAAARTVFSEHGYETATTREIAERADVGRGTVFLYARDKRDLLLMIVNDDLDRLTEHPHVFDHTPPLEDQVVAFFAPRYAFWGREPQLSRAALREIGTSYAPGQPGVELARGIGRRSRVVERLADALSGWMTVTGTQAWTTPRRLPGHFTTSTSPRCACGSTAPLPISKTGSHDCAVCCASWRSARSLRRAADFFARHVLSRLEGIEHSAVERVAV
jgi:AcrR family transcriptional regulator